jgi:hypothetical protein
MLKKKKKQTFCRISEKTESLSKNYEPGMNKKQFSSLQNRKNGAYYHNYIRRDG